MDKHAKARQVRAAIFGGDPRAGAAFAGLRDVLSGYAEELAVSPGGPGGRLVSLEFGVAERIVEVVEAVGRCSSRPWLGSGE